MESLGTELIGSAIPLLVCHHQYVVAPVAFNPEITPKQTVSLPSTSTLGIGFIVSFKVSTLA